VVVLLESWHCDSIVHLPQEWVGESRKDDFSGWVSVVGVVILSYMHYHHTQGQSGNAPPPVGTCPPPIFGWGTLSQVSPIIWGVKFSLLLDFMVFYFTKTHFTLMLTKKVLGDFIPHAPYYGCVPGFRWRTYFYPAVSRANYGDRWCLWWHYLVSDRKDIWLVKSPVPMFWEYGGKESIGWPGNPDLPGVRDWMDSYTAGWVSVKSGFTNFSKVPEDFWKIWPNDRGKWVDWRKSQLLKRSTYWLMVCHILENTNYLSTVGLYPRKLSLNLTWLLW